MRRAVKKAREEHEPVLVEATSFRFRGHSVVDPDRYRDEEVVRRGRERDPIPAFAKYLQDLHLLNKQDLQEIEERVEQDVEEAVQFADESPFPPLESLYDYIYAPDDLAQERR
jgi:pyruvate dehydrogenase E1 component alpha subunit